MGKPKWSWPNCASGSSSHSSSPPSPSSSYSLPCPLHLIGKGLPRSHSRPRSPCRGRGPAGRRRMSSYCSSSPSPVTVRESGPAGRRRRPLKGRSSSTNRATGSSNSSPPLRKS